jgi:hypothetical protein
LQQERTQQTMLRPHRRRAGASRRRLRGRGRQVSGPCLPGVASLDSLGLSMRRRTASRRRRARNGRARPGSGPPAVVLLHDAKQPAPRLAPRSTSRSRGAWSASGVVTFALSPRISAAFADHCAGLRPKPWSSSAPTPEPRGPAERREAHYLELVAPVRRDATLARRSRPAQPGRRLSALHRGVCPKPAASPALPEPGQGWLAGPLFMGGCEPRAFHPRLRAASRTPHPRSACWIVSGRRPSRARMGDLLLQIRYEVKK